MDTIMETFNIPNLVDKVRERLVKEMTTHPDLYDECDLEKVKTDDWTIKRFLYVGNKDEETSFTMARDAMKWRKEFGVNSRTDLDYPLEIYQIGAIFTYAEDKEGRVVVYLRIKMHIPSPKFSLFLQEYVMHLFNKVDTQCREKGFTMVWDLNGAGPSNWHYETIKFIVTSRSYFPAGIRLLLVYGCPWIMNPFLNIVIAFMPEDAKSKLKNISKEQIFEYIDKANVPDFIKGGECKQDYHQAPKGVRDAKDMAQDLLKRFGITEKEMEKVLKSYEKYLK